MQKNKIILLILGTLLFILLAVSAVAADYNLKYKSSAFPKVLLIGQSYAGSSKAQAQKSLDMQIAETYKDSMKFIYKDKTYEVALSDLGISIDSGKTIENVFSYGHRQDLWTSANEQIGLLGSDVNFKNELVENGFMVAETKWDEISKIENPAQNFSYEWNNGAFVPVATKEGFVIDKVKLKQDIENNLTNLQNNPIQIELIKDSPVLRSDTDKNALAQAQALIEKQVVLKYDSATWNVDKNIVGSWIGFTPQTQQDENPVLTLAPNKNKIKEYLAYLAPEINHEPVNAQLEFKDSKIGIFALSQDGIKIDTDASADKIGAEIFQAKNYSSVISAKTISAPSQTDNTKPQTQNIEATPGNQIAVELIANKVSPELTTDSIDNMGITSLIATGESNFHGSTTSRVHNITVGANKFNGVLIGPGDTFSFDNILGSVGAKEGYLPELVIKSGKTTPEYGGGLCQVSTTAFRAAVAAGLEVTARTNHAYTVKYYAPQGTDATIYPPNPDLVFINNTPAYILIQTRMSGTYLYFDFYGTNDGRKVVTEGPVVYERSAGGAMKTWWKQSVYDKDGKMFLTKTFYSNYKPAALYPRTNPLE